MRAPSLLPALAVVSACASHAMEARIDRSIAPLLKDFPSAAVLVERGGVTIFDKAFGYADLENLTPATRRSVYCIGSVSKQFGAAAVLQLVEAGKLRLDEPLSRFYPDFPRADRITIADLLHHTSGIADFEYEGTWPKTMAVARTDDELIATFRDLPPKFEPGTQWGYSSSNYFLLGQIVQKVSGVPLAQYLKKNVFDRAGLTDTRFCDAHELIAHRAHGYDVPSPGTFVPARMTELTEFGIAGGLCSTTHDLLAWQHALEEGRVISAESYRLMSTAHPLPSGAPTGYGFGLFPSEQYGHPIVGHPGGVAGYGALLTHYVRDDLRIAILVNTEDASAYPLALAIARDVIGLSAPPAKPITRAELSRYAVTAKVDGRALRFVVADGQLAVVASDSQRKPLPLAFVGDGTFDSAEYGLEVKFELAQGRVARIVLELEGMTSYPVIVPTPK